MLFFNCYTDAVTYSAAPPIRGKRITPVKVEFGPVLLPQRLQRKISDSKATTTVDAANTDQSHRLGLAEAVIRHLLSPIYYAHVVKGGYGFQQKITVLNHEP